MDRLLKQGLRTVTSLDGDVVRRNLSAGLTFSKEHRELNVRRIGYVAAEVTRHGGVALCAPIAPYASVRAEVRAMVEAHGRFVLVHVSTPLEACEARDRKGLYAKARRGEIPEFTGISDPYETPADADVNRHHRSLDRRRPRRRDRRPPRRRATSTSTTRRRVVSIRPRLAARATEPTNKIVGRVVGGGTSHRDRDPAADRLHVLFGRHRQHLPVAVHGADRARPGGS